ncbi:MAG: DNA/RNA helicase, partial [Spirochaetia bacterium]|nr:DNA/RNA helicase [Spirochaetia bacterium]
HVIEEFKELDIKQQKFASLRVKLQLDSKRPDSNGSMGGEESILRKEDGKKRKFKSVRRLFAEIPHLLMDMKPCLLMSPLAVSQYLHPELYEFDTVIFDEASQIKTQDAVSSILRAKQSIIVGDKKQLPPTTFFEASESDEDYDSFVGDDEEDSGVLDTYESVLEEASLIFPSPTLRWHYRSRYEQLIMFSNSELYDNALITFPSHTQNYPNTGVEFVYVQNGIYDKGKSRKNLIEAEKVADLIFEHFTNFPNRSLGVVTCSQSQQQCIEDVLEKRRDQNRIYERFFDESKEESFFIKNIETVQGDERDTIFFSIGYGPSTLHGPVPMMFGPINRLGGERRLNVAITRAKENVKPLVNSNTLPFFVTPVIAFPAPKISPFS